MEALIGRFSKKVFEICFMRHILEFNDKPLQLSHMTYLEFS